MFKYTLKQSIKDSCRRPLHSRSNQPYYGWFRSVIKPLIPEELYSGFHEHAMSFTEVKYFSLYHPRADLQVVYMSGYPFPVSMFEVS